ncbi:MAG: hypothetical protein COA43_04850 [Robiginitomaculum sp.]|nr:MAG: hypothetical protein COA43_04850 [Robiginitomaculum sp.]
MRGIKTTPKGPFTRLVHISMSACLGSLALISPMAFAGEPDAKNNLAIKSNPTATLTSVCDRKDKSDFDALIYATCYSERYQAVAVLVRGNAKSTSGQKIADYLVGEFGKSYVPAVGFLGEKDRVGVSIVFFLNGDYYGPYSGNEWRDGMKTLVRHSAEAWHQSN